MFSDKFASLFHLSALRKSCKSLVRVIKFEGVASSPRALTCERNLKRSEHKSTKQCRNIDAETVQKGAHFDTSSQNASEVATELKKAAPRGPRGVPGGSPSDRGASPGGPWSTPGAPSERPNHPRSVQSASKVSPRGPLDTILAPFGPQNGGLGAHLATKRSSDSHSKTTTSLPTSCASQRGSVRTS